MLPEAIGERPAACYHPPVVLLPAVTGYAASGYRRCYERLTVVLWTPAAPLRGVVGDAQKLPGAMIRLKRIYNF